MLAEQDWRVDSTWRGTPGANGQPELGRYYNKGMRIDYVLVQACQRVASVDRSPWRLSSADVAQEPLSARVARAVVLGHGPAREGFLGSDHCPLLVEITSGDAPRVPLAPSASSSVASSEVQGVTAPAPSADPPVAI